MAGSSRYLFVVFLFLHTVSILAFAPTLAILPRTRPAFAASAVRSRLATPNERVSIRRTQTRIHAISGPAILERPAVQRKRDEAPVKERKGMGNEAWEVRIYNDGLNTREHVARSLVQVTGLSEFQAYQTMMQAHQNGIAVVGRWVYEVAEMFHDALRKKGIVCDIIPVDDE